MTSLYLTDANDTLYLAEHVDPRHVPAVGPLYRLTPVDVLEAAQASLAATRAYLDAHKPSGTPPPDAPGGGPVPSAVDPLQAPQSSEGATPSPAWRRTPSGAIRGGEA